ncbi:MAG: hypothetical protein MZV63_39060 [Marinilabiliales bacterium]|nr:hypothetical protein [Marinilabiliales bacterium]
MAVVSYMIPGEAPACAPEIRGDYISYSGTVLADAPHKELAMKFFATSLLSEEGSEDLQGVAGRSLLSPPSPTTPAAVPSALQKYLR